MTQLVELSDLHVFIRPIFMETIVLNGIVTRQHQGHDRMSTDFCTHIVISTAKVSHMDRLRLGAELADYVLFLDKFRVMLDGVTIYRVNDETFVATGPIPPSCIKGIYVAGSGRFRSMYVSTLTSKSPLEGGNVPTRGRALGAKSASGGYVPARTPNVGSASGGNAPARDQTHLLVGAMRPHAGLVLTCPLRVIISVSVYLVNSRGGLMTFLTLVVPLASDR